MDEVIKEMLKMVISMKVTLSYSLLYDLLQTNKIAMLFISHKHVVEYSDISILKILLGAYLVDYAVEKEK